MARIRPGLGRARPVRDAVRCAALRHAHQRAGLSQTGRRRGGHPYPGPGLRDDPAALGAGDADPRADLRGVLRVRAPPACIVGRAVHAVPDRDLEPVDRAVQRHFRPVHGHLGERRIPVHGVRRTAGVARRQPLIQRAREIHQSQAAGRLGADHGSEQRAHGDGDRDRRLQRGDLRQLHDPDDEAGRLPAAHRGRHRGDRVDRGAARAAGARLGGVHHGGAAGGFVRPDRHHRDHPFGALLRRRVRRGLFHVPAAGHRKAGRDHRSGPSPVLPAAVRRPARRHDDPAHRTALRGLRGVLFDPHVDRHAPGDGVRRPAPARGLAPQPLSAGGPERWARSWQISDAR